jgi:hypothetical protein
VRKPLANSNSGFGIPQGTRFPGCDKKTATTHLSVSVAITTLLICSPSPDTSTASHSDKLLSEVLLHTKFESRAVPSLQRQHEGNRYSPHFFGGCASLDGRPPLGNNCSEAQTPPVPARRPQTILAALIEPGTTCSNP